MCFQGVLSGYVYIEERSNDRVNINVLCSLVNFFPQTNLFSLFLSTWILFLQDLLARLGWENKRSISFAKR